MCSRPAASVRMMPGCARTGRPPDARSRAHRGPQREAPSVDPGGGAAAEEAFEGLRDRVRVSVAHQRLADVRAADGAVLGGGRQVVGVERIAELRETLEDARVALVAIEAELGERRLQRLAGAAVEEVAEHVHRDAIVLEVDLHAGHDADAEALAGGERLGQTVDRVVVGDGDGREAQSRRLLHELRGGQRAVREQRMRVQVDHAPSLPHEAATHAHRPPPGTLRPPWVSSA